MSRNPSDFARVDDHGSDYFIRFLDARTSLAAEVRVKQMIVEHLRLQDGLSVLDIGCGTGVDTCELARAVGPGGSVVGLDHSARMVEEARRRAGALGLPVSFVQGEATALPYPDGTFDRCRGERVLAFVPDPAVALRELARVTRPGGLIVVSEIDMRTMFLSGGDTQFTDAVVDSFIERIASPTVGRRLQRHFVEAGLVDVRCVPDVMLNSVAFLRLVFNDTVDQLVSAGTVTSAAADAFWDEQERGEREGWLCTGVTCFTVVGHKSS